MGNQHPHIDVEPSLKRQAAVRLVEYAVGREVALPPHTTHSLLERPRFEVVPGAARHAYGLLSWQGIWMPLLDLYTLLRADSRVEHALPPAYALVLAYQGAPRQSPDYGAIALASVPRTISVRDDMQCALPTDSEAWPWLALSCFEHEGRAIPILDTSRLFAVCNDESAT